MIEDIEILFGTPKRAKKRERIKNKHSKKFDVIRTSERDDRKYLQRLSSAWDTFERRYNSQRGFSDFGSGYSERGESSGQGGIFDPNPDSSIGWTEWDSIADTATSSRPLTYPAVPTTKRPAPTTTTAGTSGPPNPIYQPTGPITEAPLGKTVIAIGIPTIMFIIATGVVLVLFLNKKKSQIKPPRRSQNAICATVDTFDPHNPNYQNWEHEMGPDDVNPSFYNTNIQIPTVKVGTPNGDEQHILNLPNSAAISESSIGRKKNRRSLNESQQNLQHATGSRRSTETYLTSSSSDTEDEPSRSYCTSSESSNKYDIQEYFIV